MKVGKHKFAYTLAGLKRAEALARKTNQRVEVDRSVYGPSNTSPSMKKRTTVKRRKAPRAYKTNMKI